MVVTAGLDRDPQWYKDAIIYELHVRAFADSDGDGVGDFRGLRAKLGYLQDLGVTALWLLPFYPSPLRDDGYDIADYRRIHPAYGTLREFRAFLSEAHDRGMRVITELVINHTSDQHQWFQRARRAKPGSRWRDYYVWSDTPDRYQQARVIFQDFEASNWTWDPVANAYYWHRFYSHQPDLNFDNREVHEAIRQVMDFWLDMGVDGLRLDAIPYLYEREGTSCENLPETHQFLKELRGHLDTKYDDRLFLAEANQWPEDSVTYFGRGDECHMAFHFPLMPRLFMAIQMEDSFPVLDILEQTPDIPESCQWAIFLRNHDELTLEMVTDEERDYMYRVYAQEPQARINLGIRRRLAPLLSNNRRKIELMNGLLLSLPGTPVLYYGDEIGMGDNIYLGDRNGVRTPMQWSADRNAGFSRANPQQLYLPIIIDPEYHYETVNVEAHQNNPHSLLWWTKRLIALRKSLTAFSRGSLQFLTLQNRKVLAFVRRFEDEQLLLVYNLSRFSQYAELDLSEFNGMLPVELFGRSRFPPIGDLPYFITLGPHAFYWFSLEPQRVDGRPVELAEVESEIPSLPAKGRWQRQLADGGSEGLRRVLPEFLRQQRWFGGKARRIRQVQVQDAVPIDFDDSQAVLALLSVEYTDGDPENYALPLAFATGDRAADVARHSPGVVLAWLQTDDPGEAGVLYDALGEPRLAETLLHGIDRKSRWRNQHGELVAQRDPPFRELAGDDPLPAPNLLRVEQSNSAVAYGDRLFLKLYRKVEPGPNPDLELGGYLTRRGFPYVPKVAGSLSYERDKGEPWTIGILQEFVSSQGDAFAFTLDEVGRFYERVLTSAAELPSGPPVPAGNALSLADVSPPPAVEDWLEPYPGVAALLGQRTGQLHQALAAERDDPAYAPEPLTKLRLRSIYQSMRSSGRRTLQSLEQARAELPAGTRQLAEQVLAAEAELLEALRSITKCQIGTELIRIHGDYHLGQVLYTGKDFIIIDFEGEPARPASERRLKRSALRDVAGMLRSFDYAANTALRSHDVATVRPEDRETLLPWADIWGRWSSAIFLGGYLAQVEGEPFLPTGDDLAILLRAYLLDKAVYEIHYEMNNRPDWLPVPLKGVLDILESWPDL
jgi:maltose alpha-D-glucosyltransferase/alpha-amylase